jgi:RimJ/RimL family protein N-acetyltransferase
MTFYPSEQPVPTGLDTPRLLLEPLQPKHVALDYDAVMDSREQLRLWSGSTWPTDDFTLADNLRDLEHHWREHQERIAFTFTVLDQARQTCLGCVYMRPLSELMVDNPLELVGAAGDETHIRFWVRTSRLDSGLDHHLLSVLLGWLETDWLFSRVLFGTRQADTQQLRMLDESPLHRALTLHMPDRGGAHIFFEA